MKEGVIHAFFPCGVGHPIEGIRGPVVELGVRVVYGLKLYYRFIIILKIILVAPQVDKNVLQLI